MPLKARFFFDEDGIPRAVFADEYMHLSGFLFDFQNVGGSFKDLFRAVRDVQSGERRSWEMGGNDHHVTLLADGAHIENEFSDPPGYLVVSLEDFADAARRWQAFLATRPKG